MGWTKKNIQTKKEAEILPLYYYLGLDIDEVIYMATKEHLLTFIY